MSTILRKEAWLDHVNSWKESGLSISKYCTENGLKSRSFHYWIRKAGKETYRLAGAGSFVKLKIPELISNRKNPRFLIEIRSFQIFLGQFESLRVIRHEERLYLNTGEFFIKCWTEAKS